MIPGGCGLLEERYECVYRTKCIHGQMSLSLSLILFYLF